jgi:hypothetical protein
MVRVELVRVVVEVGLATLSGVARRAPPVLPVVWVQLVRVVIVVVAGASLGRHIFSFANETLGVVFEMLAQRAFFLRHNSLMGRKYWTITGTQVKGF